MESVRFARLEAADDPAVREAIQRVLASGRYVLGPEVEAFESAFAEAVGVRHAVGVASGTDAITLALVAAGVGPGDRVLTSAFSAGYTGVGIRRTGAAVAFCDVEPHSLGMDATAAEAAIATGRFRAVVPVHLYGSAPPRFDRVLDAARAHGVPVIEDASQAHGARFGGRPVGGLGLAAAFSFYPTKNLGALGDAGLVATDDDDIARRVRRFRNGGQIARHAHGWPGWNSRLDELQAAVLSVRLARLDAGLRARRRLARRYREGLGGLPVGLVAADRSDESARHLFVLRSPRRDALRSSLHAAGVETLIHYPVPLPLQPAFRTQGATPEEAFPEAIRAADEVVSLPFHPGITEAEADRVVAAVRDYFDDDAVAE